MNTKLHAICDSEGRPLNLFVTAGQVSDYIGARALLSSLPDVDWLLEQAEEIGFPIFVKAVAGGGGRGMRRVDAPANLPAALDEAMAIRNTTIAEELALPPVKIHCSILAEDAIKAAVKDYKAKHDAVVEAA